MKKLKIAVLYVAKFLLIFKLTRFLTRYYPRILCYHGGCLLDEDQLNSLLFIKKEFFKKRINWLIDNKFKFNTLDQLSNKSKNTVVITFDDGWYSTYSELIPILINKNIPSTIYLSTYYYQKQTPIIPVVISYIAWKSLNTEIDLNQAELNTDGIYSLKNKSSVNSIIKIIESIAEKNNQENETLTLIEKIANLANVKIEDLDLKSRRFSYMNRTELKSLINKCRIELHGHKHVYPIGSPIDFEHDLKECTNIIKNQLDIDSRHYCYPSGLFDSNASVILDKLEITTATTCIPGLINDFEKQKHYLPRFLDGSEITTIEFEAEMMGFNHYLRKFFKK